MKTAKLFTLLAFVLTLAACNKDKDELRHERDITYTVAEETTTVHLTTEAEWQQLLDRFCDYAEEGSEVTFYNASRVQNSQFKIHNSAKDATTFSTTDREAMKRWMAQMEDAGMTVTVSYDPNTGTWNGTAYATTPQPRHDCYTGLLTEVPNPQMAEGPNLPGMVMALRLNEDSTLIIADHGQWFWDGYLPLSDSSAIYPGGPITLCGTVEARQDYNGDTFLQLEIGPGPQPAPTPNPVPHPNGGVLTYVCDASPMWRIIMSIDTVNNYIYATGMMYDSINPFIGYNLYVPVGISRYHYYSPADSGGTTYEDKVWLYVENDEGLDYLGEHYCITGSLDFSGDFTLHYADAAPTDGYTVTEFPFVRNDDILTAVHRSEYCDVVLHLNTDGQYSEGQSYLLSRVNCVLPFESGKFSYAQVDTIAYNGDWQFQSVERLRYSVTGSTPTFGIDYPNCPCSYWVPLGDTPSCIETFHFEHL